MYRRQSNNIREDYNVKRMRMLRDRQKRRMIRVLSLILILKKIQQVSRIILRCLGVVGRTSTGN